MSCEYVTRRAAAILFNGGACIRPAEWLVEGNDLGPFELDHPSTHARKVCGEGEHLLDTIREFTEQGVSPVLVSAYVEQSESTSHQSGGRS
jgi:hypothetical protein